MNPNIVRNRKLHKVLDIRLLTTTTFIVRFERQNMDFSPGQHIYVGVSEFMHMREYSIYSGKDDDYLEILVKEIPQGLISPRLRALKPGDNLYIAGPFGMFRIFDDMKQSPLTFISTGTGIAPFHCFVRSYPDLDYTLLHGTRYDSEQYEINSYEEERLIRCISQEEGKHFQGRVTHFIKENPVSSMSSVFLCGNSDMIYETYDLLQDQGIVRSRVFAEVYF